MGIRGQACIQLKFFLSSLRSYPAFRIHFRNATAVEMQMVEPDSLEEFFKDEAAWARGKVEQTKRELADVFNRRDKENCRGSVVLLAYDSDDVNNRVRVAAKQVRRELLSSYIVYVSEFALRIVKVLMTVLTSSFFYTLLRFHRAIKLMII